jgi:hypothetical protein
MRIVARRADALVVEVEDDGLADWVVGRYGPLLEKVASAVVGESICVDIRGRT